MHRREKLSTLAIGFFGGRGVHGLYEHPGWWRNWHSFEIPALSLVVALPLMYLRYRQMKRDNTL